jgi:DNA repair ATPase RecN
MPNRIKSVPLSCPDLDRILNAVGSIRDVTSDIEDITSQELKEIEWWLSDIETHVEDVRHVNSELRFLDGQYAKRIKELEDIEKDQDAEIERLRTDPKRVRSFVGV